MNEFTALNLLWSNSKYHKHDILASADFHFTEVILCLMATLLIREQPNRGC